MDRHFGARPRLDLGGSSFRVSVMVDRSVPRDIFPLPPPDAPRADGSRMKMNLPSRRRHGRRLHAESARWAQPVR